MKRKEEEEETSPIVPVSCIFCTNCLLRVVGFVQEKFLALQCSSCGKLCYLLLDGNEELPHTIKSPPNYTG